MVEGHNAGMPRLNHADLDAGPQSHFAEAANEVGFSLNIEDRTRFTGIEQVHGNDLYERTTPGEQRQLSLRLSLSSRYSIRFLPHEKAWKGEFSLMQRNSTADPRNSLELKLSPI